MAHHPSYMREVETKFGKETVKLMLNLARSGGIADSQMSSIAEKLGRDLEANIIFGNHSTRMKRDRFAGSDILLKCILSDWWGAELFDLSPEEARSKMVEVCQDPDVALRPLAKQLLEAAGRECSPQQLGDTQGEER